MKKLIIIMAAIAFTAISQAATVDWSVFEISSRTDSSGTASGLAVYFVDSAVTSQSAATSALAANDLTFLNSAFSAGTSVDGEAYATAGTYGNGVLVTGYAIIFDTADVASAANYFMTAETAASTGGAGQPASIEFYATATATPSAWTAVAPEPTSGLLLLLGMAGLALKRKRA